MQNVGKQTTGENDGKCVSRLKNADSKLPVNTRALVMGLIASADTSSRAVCGVFLMQIGAGLFC